MKRFFIVYTICVILFFFYNIPAPKAENRTIDDNKKNATNRVADSLRIILNIIDEIEKPKVLNELAVAYAHDEPEKVFIYSEEALSLAKKYNNSTEIAKAISNIGLAYSNTTQYDKSLLYLQKSIKINEITENKEGIANSYNNMGNVYHNLGNKEKALEYHSKALKIRKELNDQHGIAMSLNNLANIYSTLNDNTNALEYYFKVLEIAKQAGGKYQIPLHNIGNTYVRMGKYDKALEYFFLSMEACEKAGDKMSIVYNKNAIGNAYMKQKKYDLAYKYINEGKNAAQELNLPSLVIKSYYSLSGIFSQKGDYKNALKYFQKYSALRDSIFTLKNHEKIAEIQIKYETEKKESEIKLLQHEKKIDALKKYILAGGLVLLVIITCMIYYWQRNKIRSGKMEKQNLISELKYKNKELENFALHIIQKNEFLENIKNDLNKIKRHENGILKINELSQLINQYLRIDKDRKEFHAQVEMVNQTFFHKLQQKFDLTDKEKRLSALLKLNLSSKEISSLINISPRSVDMGRHRLRKKLNINHDKSISDFLNEL